VPLITQAQIDDWAESKVTEALLDYLKEQLEETYKERSDMFIPGEAERTQEVRANLIGQEAVYNDLVELLSLKSTELLDKYILEEREEWTTQVESTPPGTAYS